MPEPLLHFTLPFLLARSRLSFRESILIGLAGLLPDLDSLIRIHRWATHSLVLSSIIFLGAYIIIHFRYKRYKLFTLFLFLAIALHILMDLSQAYTPILYPLTEYSYWMNIEVNIRIGDNIEPTSNIWIKSIRGEFREFEVLDAPLFTSVGLIISITIILATMLFNRGIDS